MDQDKMSILYRGLSIDASSQVSVHLAEGLLLILELCCVKTVQVRENNMKYFVNYTMI
jgi:hypothetical protein